MGALPGHRLARAMVLGVIVWSEACARPPVESRPAAASRATAGPRDRLMGEEIPRRGSMEDVLLALRPEFLRVRSGIKGATDAYPPVAYLDGVLLDDLSVLRQIPAASIGDVRFLRPTEASVRFRRHHPSGAVVMVSRR